MFGLFMLLLREDGDILGRKRSRFGKGPQGGNRTWVAVSTVCAICRCTNNEAIGDDISNFI